MIGLAVALELARRRSGAEVVLIDKESSCGAHASGRNSGVLHAGFYYTGDSLKARFCRDGNAALRRYCEERALRLHRSGKLVVAQRAADLGGLDELERRARGNGVELRAVTEAEARAIEPTARTVERALWSPTTCVVDPPEIVASLERDAEAAGVRIARSTRYVARTATGIRTQAGEIRADYIVNAAGLYADRIAHDFGFGRRYAILPFKGLYLHSSEPAGTLRTHIYPVPDLAYPFLGVHFTLTVDGRTKIGPTAVPALWREQYGGLSRFSLGELLAIATRQAGLYVRSGFDFRRLAREEARKMFRRGLIERARRLRDGIDARNYRRWGTPGIRAQLLDLSERRLIHDFVLEGDDRSLHILNAVSPAFTCAFPLASHIAERVEALAGQRAATREGRVPSQGSPC